MFGMLELILQDVCENLLPWNIRLHDASREFFIVCIPLGQRCQQEVILAIEVPQQRGMSHVSTRGDVSERGSLVPVLGEAGDRGANNLCAPRGCRGIRSAPLVAWPASRDGGCGRFLGAHRVECLTLIAVQLSILTNMVTIQ